MQAIKFKRTGEAGKIPAPESLQVGEIALQLADHVIFTKDKDHNVVQISVSPETHDALESKVDAHKEELDQTIALNDQNIHAKVDEIKTATDATITANHEEINTKVDTIKRETDATIEANKNKAASDLAAVEEELTDTISKNKDAAAVATEELDTRINKKVDDIKKRTDETITANNTEIHEKVDLIKAQTDRTIAANAEHAQNQLEETFNHLTGVIADNKEIAAQAVTALSSTVEEKDTAIHAKVDGNKTHTDSEIARLDARINDVDGSSDGKFILKGHGTFHNSYLMTKTANYLEDETVSGAEYLDYFGAYRVNGMDNWGNATGLILNVPHAYGKAHGRGFEFQYASAGSMVRTYGFDANGEKIYSHRMYHEGDKPTPAELNVYSKEEINGMFQKTIWFDPAGGWFKIATLVAGQNWGKGCNIRLIGGNGYNFGSWGQTKIIELVIRNSNDNPKGMNLVAYENCWNGVDQGYCIVNTEGDTYEIYASYGEHSTYVMAQYQQSTDAVLTVHDNPQRFEQKPENAVDGHIVRAFGTQINRGTLNFNANGHEYDTEHLTTAPAGRKGLRKFRSHNGSMIWHETVEATKYQLFTGDGQNSLEFQITAIGNDRGAYVEAGRFVAGGGNDGYKIMYDPATESAMYQIYSRLDGSLNAYMGYGDRNQNIFTIHNRLGDINVATNGYMNVLGHVKINHGELHLGVTDPNNPSNSVIHIQNWGNSEHDRPIVFEMKDDQGYHFYSQRRNNGNIEFQTAGSITAANGVFVHGGHGLEITSATNRHVWFKGADGSEKAVLYAEDDGGVKLRTSNQQYSTRFGDGMIHTTGQMTTGSDRGLIRGAITGGAWVHWRDRPAGLLVDCQNSQNDAYNIWKATHWGQYHIAAMGVHAGGGNAHVTLHVGGSDYSFAYNGDFTAGAAVYCNDVYIRSDARLKINVEDYEDGAIEKINTLKVKTYDKVRSLSDREVIGREVGIIAQDLQKVLPEAVSVKNIAKQGEEAEEVLTISNSAVNAMLVKAVQEMSAKMEAMSKELAELKSQVK
ncbi:tail fiber domain-containing protein [Salmonella enterica subsp. enterica]|nr:tail fiber domain-containing protein [Salmonella enterica subsp. enterica]EDV1533685.1 tail fiber domain-containing protein [Salmonella enterica subsp. enterica]